MSTYEVTLPSGQKQDADDILGPWKKRRDAARRARRPFEQHWLENQAFAAGYQHVRFSPRDHRAIDIAPMLAARGRSDAKADVLTQYIWTAIGKFAKDDFRPQLLFQHDDAEGEDYGEGANKAFGWGWDEEWDGDETLLNILLTLATFGTGAVRCRYDKTRGPLVGELPHPAENYTHRFTDDNGNPQQQMYPAGKPIMDETAARAFVAESRYYGENVNLKAVREGAIVWELLSPWNLLPPPAIEYDRDFPWHLIVRPVHVDQLQTMYGDRAAEVKADELEAMNVLGLKTIQNVDPETGYPGGSDAKLEDHALVYTGYEMPCPKYPKGATIVFTQDGHLLDYEQALPYNEQPHGPRPGLTYFHYWKVKQRFWGRGLYDAGKGPQRIRNKRLAQQDEYIDRSIPKVYVEEGTIAEVPTGLMLEQVTLGQGATKPLIDNGPGVPQHFREDIELQDVNIEKALGLHAVSLGATASASAPYARIALESENDADKLDPIAKDFKLGIADLSRDSLEAMRNWPEGKLLLIAGEDDRLEALTFSRSEIPSPFMVKPPKGSSIPRSQGAELQKINDLWQAAYQSGVVAANPAAWLEWYKDSLDQGKALPMPAQSLEQQQRHKAALENVVMVRTGQPLPVAPYDDPQSHMAEHAAETNRLSEALIEAPDDQQLQAGLQALQQHSMAHEQAAAATAPPVLPPTGGPPSPPSPALSPVPPAAPPMAA